MLGEPVRSDDPRLSENERRFLEIRDFSTWLGLKAMSWLLPAIDSYKTPEIRPTAVAFEKNLATVISIGDVLDRTWITAMLFNASESAACLELFGTIKRPMLDFEKLRDEDASLDSNDDEYKSYAEKCGEIRQLQKRLIDGTVQSRYFCAGGSTPADYANFFTDDDKAKLRSLMASQVVLAWTAFETLAGDLWEAALNTAPHRLAELNGSSKRIGKKAGAASRQQEQQEQQESEPDPQKMAERTGGPLVRLWRVGRVTKHNYDLRRRMGTLLRSRFKFTTLTGIRQAYSCAFSENEKHADADSIDEALKSNDLDVASAVRNLLVHKGGVADEDYVKACKGLLDAPNVPQDEQLQLTGWMVSRLIRPLVACSIELLQAVDVWLEATAVRQQDPGRDGGSDAPSSEQPPRQPE